MRRIKVFLFNGILLTVTGFIMKSIEMVFNIYISNKIGSEAIGLYQLIMSVYMFSITLATSGIHLATTRIISEQLAYDIDIGIKKAMNKCIKYCLVMSFFACFLLLIFSNNISHNILHNKINSIPLRILAISLPFLSLSSCINGYFTALRKVKKTVYTQFIEVFFKIFLITWFLNMFFPPGLDYACISLVLGSTLSEILSFIFLLFLYLLDKKKLSSKGFTNTNFTKQILKIAIPISFTSYIRSGLSCLKQILIPINLEKSGLSCNNALSQYGIINGMVMPLIMFPCTFIYSFSSLLIPEFSYMNAKKEYNKINIALNKIFKVCFIFSFLIMGIFWCFSEEFNKFIYPNSDIAFFIKILSPLIVLMYIDNIVDSILKGLDKQVSVMGINILDLISTILFICFLLPIQGIKGYIIVLFISEILNGILSLLLLIKETKFKIDFNNLILKPLFSIIILNVIFSCIRNINSVLEFILYVLLFIVLYFILLIFTRSIIKNDIQL